MNSLFFFNRRVMHIEPMNGPAVLVTLDDGRKVSTVWNLLSRNYRTTFSYPQR